MEFLGQIIQFTRLVVAWAITIMMSSFQLLGVFSGIGRWCWEIIPYYWSVMTFGALGVRINVVGREKLHVQGVYIVNHQSVLDVVLVPYLLPRRVLYVVKAELEKIPVFGPAVCKLGAIKVDRRNRISAVKSITKGIDEMPKGYSIMVFPEGTRSLDGKIARFKKGFAHIALLGRFPIIPIGIAGAIDSCPPNCIVPMRGSIECTVGDSISTEDWTLENIEEKVEMVQGVVRELQAVSEERRYGRFINVGPSIPMN